MKKSPTPASISRQIPTRRSVLGGAGALGAAVSLNALLPGWARAAADGLKSADQSVLSGTSFQLEIDRTPFVVDGRRGRAVTINGTVPGPILRWREGDVVTLDVTNKLNEDTSIHWHGLILPPDMDGVPGISFPGIKPGETFRYRFPVKQAGTYWYHSHSGLQEPMGHYGPLVIEPKNADPVQFDREVVIVLSDWSFESSHRVFAKLKKQSDVYNVNQRTIGDFFRRARRGGLRDATRDRAMWGRMRMMPTDISDVTGATYTYLINGHGPADNWSALFEPGERVRLRFVNAAAMTLFNVRIPGLPMTVVQADGLDVQPVEVDEFQIGNAETFDVIVQPEQAQAFSLIAEAIDRTGMARATLQPRPGMRAPVPPLRQPPLLTMKDMGMDHGQMGHGDMNHGQMDHSQMDHGAMRHGDTPGAPGESMKAGSATSEGAVHPEGAGMDHASMDHGSMDPEAVDHAAMNHDAMNHDAMDHETMDHAAMGHGATEPSASADPSHDDSSPGDSAHPIQQKGEASEGPQAHDHRQGPGVANTADVPISRLDEPGVGLEDVSHRVLVYSDLKSLEENPDLRPPGRTIELHLTGNMERYMWSFDGEKFSEVTGTIEFFEGERLRLVLVNDTMMPHPIHLHGMFFDVVNGAGTHKPRKHTVVVKPGERLAVDISADAVGDWAFHCHLVYHMHAGMFRVVSVKPAQGAEHSEATNEHHNHHGGA